MKKIVRTWIVKGKNGGDHNLNSYEYFIEEGCISCGFSFEDVPERQNIKDLDDYKKFWKKNTDSNKNWNKQGIHQLLDNLEKGDFVWTRKDGEYYVAEIPDEPKNLFFFDKGEESKKYDSSAQIKNLKWNKVGKEDSVPGSISTYSRGAMVKADNREGFCTINGLKYTATSVFSAICTGSLQKEALDYPMKKKDIFNLLHYSSVEDLVALWLYDKFNYVVIPSTNKISTQKYEFVLLDGSRDNGIYNRNRKVFIQVKNGKVNLNSEDYISLIESDNQEVWLITTIGKIDNEENVHIKKVYKKDSKIAEEKYNIDELINFIFDSKKQNIIPENVKRWKYLFNFK